MSKLITYGQNREEAIEKMIRAIDEYHISGVQTTLSFCRFVMNHPVFQSGSFDTNFVNLHFNPDLLNGSQNNDSKELAALLSAYLIQNAKPKQSVPDNSKPVAKSRWKTQRFG